MTTRRRYGWLLSLCCSLLLLLDGGVAARAGAKRIYVYAGADNDLVGLLRKEGWKVRSFPDADQALEKARRGAAVLLLGDSYPERPLSLTASRRSLAARKGLRVFADFASPDSLPLLKDVTFERVVVTRPLGSLVPMDLLGINRAVFCAATAREPDLVLARVAGFDTAVYGLDDTPTFPLVYHEGHCWVSTSRLSDFARLRLLPEKHWKVFWECVLTDLTGRSVVFRSWPTMIHPAYGKDEPLPPDARSEAVRKGVAWFFNGHFLVHPSWRDSWVFRYQGDGTMPVGPALPDDAPDGDGSLGILEGHCSAVYKDGRQAYRYWLRDDVQGESSMAFAIAARLLGSQAYRDIATRLSDYSFREFRDGPRDDPESPTFGLLGWAYTHKWVYYGDDNARSILGSILAGRVLGTDRWEEKTRQAIEANFRTTGLNGFRGPRLHEPDIQRNGLEPYQRSTLINPHPHFESWLWACYLWNYADTGEKKYLDLAEKAISLTMDAYPGGWRWTNGIQQERARMVLPLAWLYRVRPTAEHRAWLDRVIADLSANQVPCGAIREELGDPSKGQFGAERRNADYGNNEAPLIFTNGDPVADMLYTCNFAVFALNEAACATGDPRIRRMADDLATFLVRIQVRSDTIKNVDGAWFRAFNFRNWDYWASNADAGWGAQSTLTGWIQSWIVTTLALMEQDTSYWDITLRNPHAG